MQLTAIVSLSDMAKLPIPGTTRLYQSRVGAPDEPDMGIEMGNGEFCGRKLFLA